MQRRSFEQETFLEIGLSILAASILAAFVMLLYGRLSGTTRHIRRRRRAAPPNGSVPYERHQNIGAVAAR